MIERDNHFLLGGDFNAHHESWSHQTTPNKSGKSIYSALLQSPQAPLITAHSLGTYVNPSTGKSLTIDCMITAVDIACNASITLGPYLGSDHLPVIINTILFPKYPIIPPNKWLLNDDHWYQLNAAIAAVLNTKRQKTMLARLLQWSCQHLPKKEKSI